MTYTNTPAVVSQQTTSYSSGNIPYTSIALLENIPHSAQLEVERIFVVDRDGSAATLLAFLADTAVTTAQKKAVFIIPISRCTLNTATKNISAINLPASGDVYNYVITTPTPTTYTIKVPILSSSTVTVRRKTVSNEPLVNWVAGSRLTSKQLNLATTQSLYLLQEAIEKIGTSLTLSATQITVVSLADAAVTPSKISSTTDPWSFYGTIQTVAPTANLHATTRLYALDKFFQHGVMTKDDVAPTSSAVDILETAATAGNSGLWFNPKNGTINLWAGNAWVTVAGTPVTTANLVSTNTVQTLTAAKTFAAGTVVPFTQTGTGAVARTVDAKLKDTVSVKDFGAVGDGVTDDTTAIQTAITYAKTIGASLTIEGNYKVSKIVFDTCNGLSVYCAGAIIGLASGSYEAVLVVKNSADVTFHGRLSVSASYNTGYTSAVAVYTDNATQASLLQFNNVSCIGAKLGWKFGRSTEPDPLISEITVTGGYLYGCPSAIEVIGTQSVVSFVGCQIITGTNGGSGAWLSLPRIAVKSIGSLVTITSGECLITDVTSGALLQIEPITSATYGNQYGNIILTNVVVESASQYVLITNPSAIGTLVSGKGFVQFTNCFGYHSGNAFAMVNAAADYSGKIIFRGCNFYAGVARSQPNIYALGNLCDIWVDDYSFGVNFVQGLNGITGGIPHFSHRQILSYSNCNGQSLPLATPTILIWTSATNTQDTSHFTTNYNAATGVFTVPAGGLKSVVVSVALRTSQPTQVLDISVFINGAFSAVIESMMGGAGNAGWIRNTFALGDFVAGTTIDIRATQSGIASVTNGGQYETFKISAMV